MSDHRNGMKKQGKAQTPLFDQQKLNDDKRAHKQPGQELGTDKTGGTIKEQANKNLPSDQD